MQYNTDYDEFLTGIRMLQVNIQFSLFGIDCISTSAYLSDFEDRRWQRLTIGGKTRK